MDDTKGEIQEARILTLSQRDIEHICLVWAKDRHNFGPAAYVVPDGCMDLAIRETKVIGGPRND